MALTSDDYLEDKYPHGTLKGYQQGCRAKSCRGKKDVGVSCVELQTRYTADWSFRKSINMGISAAEIMALEKLEAEKPQKVAVKVVRKPRARVRAYAPKTSRKEPILEGQVIMPRKQYGRITTPAAHGTAEGFRRGCKTDCPSEVTCADANRAYNRENYRKNRELKVGS